MDRTLERNAVGSDVTEAVVDKIQQSNIFDNDKQLLRRIALVESKDGEELDLSDRESSSGGIWKVRGEGGNWICPGRAAVEESGMYEGAGGKLDLSRESSSGGIWKVRGGRGKELDLSRENSSGGNWKVRGEGGNWICPGRAAVEESGRYEGRGETGSVQGEQQWRNLEGTGGGGGNWICPGRAAVEESGR